MEKLAPIMKQKFWILLGVGIVMTFTGWWMATGTLAASVKDRTTKVKAAFDRIPSGEIPNNDWSTKLAARNTEQDRAVNNTAAQLWNRQVSRMTWPEDVANFARNVPYRGEIPLAARENYRLAYGYDVRRVWESVHPYIQLEGTGLVVFGQNEKVLPQKKWGALAPTSADMWDAQEDLWLMESLFQAIVDVNGGPDAQRSDASIHAIEKFDLFGGVPAAQRKTAAGGTGAAPGPGGGHGGGGGPHSGGAPMSAPGGFGGTEGLGGQSRTTALASADFDRKEEVGDDGSSRGAGPGGFGGGPSAGPSTSHGSHGGGGPTPGPGGSGGAAAVNTVRRYIEDDAALPFKTRGFYMTLIMDHRKIPSLIAELTASEKSAWPVEIVRVQMVRLHDDDIGSGTPGGGGYPGGGYPGGRGSSGGGISISSILSNTGAGASGFSSGSSGGYDDMPTSPISSGPSGGPGYGSPGTTNNLATSPAAAGLAALESSLQDPFMARVAILGYITLYKEVKPEPVVATPGVPAAPAATTTPGAVPAGPAAAPADSTTPAETPESTTTPAEGGPVEANPAKPGDAAGKVPDAPAESPAATPEAGTKPAGETSKSP